MLGLAVLMDSPVDVVREHAVWALGNIASHSPEVRACKVVRGL